MAKAKFTTTIAVRKLKGKYKSGEVAVKEEKAKKAAERAELMGAAVAVPQVAPIEVPVRAMPVAAAPMPAERERVAALPAEELKPEEIRAAMAPAAAAPAEAAPPAAPAEKIAMAEEEEVKGISLAEIAPTRRLVIPEEKLEELRAIRMRYPLTPPKPKEGEKIFAWAEIMFDEARAEIVYFVKEPELTPADERELARVKSIIEEKIDVHFEAFTEAQAGDYLKKQIDDILKLFGMRLTAEKRQTYEYYIFRDFIGLGEIQPIMNDPNVEDLSCDGVGVPIFVYHRDPRIGSVRTNVSFKKADDLDSFVMKLAQRCKKALSVAEPLLQGALPDGSRVQATLGTDIARRGSNFTIRKFTAEPLTPIHMLNFGTIDAKILAYLWFAIEHNSSVLVSGPTAAGKTSLLNSLSLFIKPALKIVSIEDTAELRLPHANWLPEVARPGFGITTTGVKIGEISMFDLLKASLRQRPDYIIVGEVRGEEAYVLFQEMASIPGNEKVLVVNSHNLKRIPIAELEIKKEFLVPTVNPTTQEVKLLPVKAKVAHPARKELYKIKTKSGREVVTTRDHSVFIYDNELKSAVVEKLKPGVKIAIPARLPCGFNDIEQLNLLELFSDIRVCAPELIKAASRALGWERASKEAGVASISDYYGKKKCALPADRFKKLMQAAGIEYDLRQLEVRFRGGKTSGAAIPVSSEFLRLIGYYIAEGCLNLAKKNNCISFYNTNKKILADMRRCIRAVTGAGIRVRSTHGFGTATELSFSHKTFFELFKKFCGAGSHTKGVPDFVFGLSKERIGHFLSALYSGDGQLRQKGFAYSTTSKKLANDLSLLLLAFGIVGRIRTRAGARKKIYDIVFYKKSEYKKFLDHVNPIGKKIKIDFAGAKAGDTTDKVNDIFLDEVVTIEKTFLPRPVPVYDLYVPGTQNFIGGFGGVLLHNTGHAGMSTLHADSMEKIIDRLTTAPIGLPAALLETLNVIVFVKRLRYHERYVRRVAEVVEVVRYDIKEKRLVTNRTFRWDSATDKFLTDKDSVMMAKLAETYGVKEEQLKAELMNRIRVLNWMKERGITYYKDVGRIISMYYSNPARVMEMVEAG